MEYVAGKARKLPDVSVYILYNIKLTNGQDYNIDTTEGDTLIFNQ